jgi:HisJ family histidinol phosphate phosphatase
MLFLWFYHACRRGAPRFMMVADHINYLTFEDPAAVHVVRRALKLAQAGDLYGAAETAGVELGHASVVSEGLRKGMRYSIGAEVDNDPRSRPDAQNIVDAMKPDGLIRSVHFLPITHPQHGENWMWAFDNPEFKEFYDVVGTERVWEIYMETLLDAIDKLPGHIVGHFYVPAKFGHWPDDATLEAYEDRLIDACAERGMAVEVNSRYLYKYYVGDDAQLEKFRAAHLRLMRKAKAKGVMVAVGSDAHSPRDQGGAFEAVLELLDEADINEIAFPLNDRLARVALRATEEILRQHSAALAAALPQTSARPRAGLPPDPAEDDDTADDETESEVEPRVESANPDAEIILPPSPEPELEPEEPVVAAAPKVKAPPKPRKSRAKVPVAAEAPPESEPIVEPAASAIAPAIEAQPEVVSAEAPVAEPAPAPAKAVAPKRTAAKAPVVAPPAPVAAPVVAPAKATKAASASKPPAAKTPLPKQSAKAPVAKPAAPKVAASKAAPVKKAEPAPKKAPAAKPTPKKSAAPAKKTAPVKKAAAAKKAAPAKKAATKAAPPKAAIKKAVKKKAPAKKAPAKKAAAKKPTAKPAAKKTARTSAASAKRSATKRPAPKKPAAKKTAKKKSARR